MKGFALVLDWCYWEWCWVARAEPMKPQGFSKHGWGQPLLQMGNLQMVARTETS